MVITKRQNTVVKGEASTRIAFTIDTNSNYAAYVFESGKIQITKLSPYDDANYHWALSDNGEDFKIILDRRIVSKMSVFGDVENKIELVAMELEKRNKDIEPKMVYEGKNLNESWRDGNFSEEDLERYLDGLKQDFNRIMFSLDNMNKKYPQYTQQFQNTISGFKDYIESIINDRRG